MALRPFRFGVQYSTLPMPDWRQHLSALPGMGYSSVFFPDHFSTQWEPATAIAAVAGANQQLTVGALVYDVDYRHPVVMAKAAATLQLLSGGRHEFGIGAGWMQSDYVEAGLPYDRAGLRIERLTEALEIIRSMWTLDETHFSGDHYQINGIARAVKVPEGQTFTPPRILIGGGGPRVLRLAGRHADIVGINPRLSEGRVTAATADDQSPDQVRRKIDWIRDGAEAAGRNFDDIELNSLTFVIALTDDPKPLREALAKNSSMSVEQVADCPLYLTGPPSEICDRLERRREETGVSYVVIQGGDPELLERFGAEIVAPLTAD